ncbi:tail protein [Microcystis phage Mae-JY29]
MKKPDSLRAALTAVFPELVTNPNRLRLWIEKGHVRCHASEDNLNFTLEYTLTVVIEEWTRSTLMIWPVLCDWLRIHQPDLLTVANSKAAIPFEADLISNQKADVSFDLALTQPVLVTRREDGGFDMREVSEAPLFAAGGPPLIRISDTERQLVPDDLFTIVE